MQELPGSLNVLWSGHPVRREVYATSMLLNWERQDQITVKEQRKEEEKPMICYVRGQHSMKNASGPHVSGPRFLLKRSNQACDMS